MILSREQVRRVDRLAVEQYGLHSLVLMENAGRGCVDKLCELGLHGTVAVCCGKGNNAGDGFVMARHLDLRGYRAKVLMWSDPDSLQGDAASNFQILAKCDVPIIVLPEQYAASQLVGELTGADWIVDALLGTGTRGEPRPPLDRVITGLNSFAAKKLAVDVPSGLDCDTGQPAQATFRADHTCTFVASKPGYERPSAQPYVGRVHVLDIGVPRKLLESL